MEPYPPGTDLPRLLRLLDPLLKVVKHVQHCLYLAPGTQAKAQDDALQGSPAKVRESRGYRDM